MLSSVEGGRWVFFTFLEIHWNVERFFPSLMTVSFIVQHFIFHCFYFLVLYFHLSCWLSSTKFFRLWFLQIFIFRISFISACSYSHFLWLYFLIASISFFVIFPINGNVVLQEKHKQFLVNIKLSLYELKSWFDVWKVPK